LRRIFQEARLAALEKASKRIKIRQDRRGWNYYPANWKRDIDTLTTNKKSALQGNALCTAAFLDERVQRRKLRINHRLLQPAA
jgi:hypothetical protein